MKNERVDKSKYLWDRIKTLEERAKSHPEISLDVIHEKSKVSDFVMPILLGEIEYYQTALDRLTSLWQESYQLERRIDIKNAMDAFDAQFNNITEKLESNTSDKM